MTHATGLLRAFGAAAAFTLALSLPAQAQETPPCAVADKPCLMREIETLTPKIEKTSWQDKTYRELAKTYCYEGRPDDAIALIAKIQNPDTKAMTIRGIGFAAADSKWPKEEYAPLFEKLAIEAKKIDHAPSQGIAWTYIAMAQALAGDDKGATLTARAMENDALRHKAFGESAEIQAERGDYDAAMASISEIETVSFRNKAYRITSKIFADRGRLEEAYKTARKIDNPYTRAQALQQILNHGNPEEDQSRYEK